MYDVYYPLSQTKHARTGVKRQHFPLILSVAPCGPAAATEVDTELHGSTSHNGSGYADYMRSHHTTFLGFITALAWRYCSLAQS